MTIIQEYTREEQGFGERTIRIVVSDDYENLFKQTSEIAEADRILTDIIDIGATNKALNTDSGSFKAANLKFGIDGSSFESGSNDEKAFWFVMDAKDYYKSRYIAVFIDPDYTTDASLLATRDFAGKVQTEVQQDDDDWDGDDYDSDINPTATYTFKALSFDVSLLSEVMLNDFMENPDPDSDEKIAPVFSHLAEDDAYSGRIAQTDVQQIFKHRLHSKRWKEDGGQADDWFEALFPNTKYGFLPPQASIKEALNLVLTKTTDVLEELYNDRIEFQVIDSELGFKTQVINHTYETSSMHTGFGTLWATRWVSMKSHSGVSVRMQDEGSEDGSQSAAFVDIYDFDPLMYIDHTNVEMVAIARGQQRFGWRGCENVLELLAKIAKSFGCYLVFDYGVSKSFTIKFVARGEVVEDAGEVFMIDARDASNQSSISGANKETTEYFTQANACAIGGVDIFVVDVYEKNGDYAQRNPSDKMIELKERQDTEKKYRQINHELLLVSASPTLEKLRTMIGYNEGYETRPINSVFRKADTQETPYSDDYFYDNSHFTRDGDIEDFIKQHTSFYVRYPWESIITSPVDMAWWINTPNLSSLFLQNPASGIIVEIDGKEIYFKDTGEFINHLEVTDKKAFETEYDITVPYWSGFGGDESGTNAAWNKVKIGSKIRLKIAAKTFVDGSWDDVTLDIYYVVADLTRDYDELSTQLKLHYIGRFNYSEPSSVSESKQDTVQSDDGTVLYSVEGNVRGYVVENEEAVIIGDSIMIMSTGRIKRTDGQENTHGRTFAIALQNGYGKDYIIDGESRAYGDDISVQTDGRVYLPDVYNFSNLGSKVFARLEEDEQVTNISESPLVARSTDEQNHVELGKIDGQFSFVLNIRERILQSTGDE